MKLTIDEIFRMIRHEKRMSPENELEVYQKWVPILEREFENFCFAIRPPNTQLKLDGLPCAKVIDCEFIEQWCSESQCDFFTPPTT